MTEDDKTTGLKKHSVRIAGHLTSLSLEDVFWLELKRIAKKRKISLAAIIQERDATRTTNLSSALRVYVLDFIKKEQEKQ